MKKLPPLPRLKKKAWRLFSEYIRRKDSSPEGLVSCFTCSRSMHWKDSDAGHYFPTSVALSLMFHEKNVHPQCTACNRYKHGNPTEYATRLQRKYGTNTLEELQSLRVENFRYTRIDYMELIEKYKQKLSEIK